MESISGLSPNGVYTLTEDSVGGNISIRGTPTNEEWIGEHTYRIKCTNGELYNSVYSNEFTITIISSCAATILNFDSFFVIDEIRVPSDLAVYQVPTTIELKDSVSV